MSKMSMGQELAMAHEVLDKAGMPKGPDLPTRLAAIFSAVGDVLLTSHDVARALQMDPSSVVKWHNEGLLPAYLTPGGHRRFKTSELLRFLTEHKMFVSPELMKTAMARAGQRGQS